MNRFNFLKYVQHFDALDTNQKEEKKRNKKYSVYNFSEHCNITKHFDNTS